jgi:Domain of Unknown Function (DUF928)
MKPYFPTTLLVIFGIAIAPTPAAEYSSRFKEWIFLEDSALQTPPPSDVPEERIPFGTRGPCEETPYPFTPLLPMASPEFSGYTLAEYPTFWFYIPYGGDRVSSGQFVLFDPAGDPFYVADLVLPNTPGLVSLSLPTSAPTMVVNQPYRWELTLYCVTETTEESEDLVSHTGFITRISNPDLVIQLSQATSEERLQIYQENELWYDIFNLLEPIFPLSEEWKVVLRQLELQALEEEAIAGSAVVVPE